MEVKNILKNKEAFKELVKTTFDQLDLDKNGEIDKHELGVALGQYSSSIGGPVVNDEIVNETMKELDKDRSNTLNLEEFEGFMFSVLIQMTN